MAFEGGLPEDLMTLILVKLPVKSLLRCKCVRKSWYSLINSPQFIRLHRSSSSSSPQFIFRRCIESGHLLSFYSYETLAHLGNDIDIPFSDIIDLDHSTFLGSFSLSRPCDGLVCLTNHIDQIFICNPATRELRSLFVPPSNCNGSGYHIDSVAFGADPNTAGKYKVVMIGVPYGEDFVYSRWEDRFGDRGAQVYDFSTDTWRETAVVIPGPFTYLVRAVSLNGAFHWCPKLEPEPWRGDNYVPNDILTFNISDEEVTESIPMPDFVKVGVTNMVLGVSSKSQLSLVYKSFGRFEICVMTEYGVKESWTRLFQIGPLPQLLLIRGFGMISSYSSKQC